MNDEHRQPEYDRDAFHRAASNLNRDLEKGEGQLFALLLLATAIVLVVLISALRAGWKPLP